MTETRTERARDFERFLTFIDAAVAIAITLLILPLVDLVPELGDGSVLELLRSHLPEIGGFLLSFLVIFNAWFTQHEVVRTVIAHDRWVTRLLMLWALTIVVLPFPTALVAEAGSQPATKVFYIGTMTLTSAVVTVMSWAVGRDRSIRDSDDKPHVAQAAGSTLAFVIALLISLAVPATSYYPLLLLLLPGPVAGFVRRKRTGARLAPS